MSTFKRSWLLPIGATLFCLPIALVAGTLVTPTDLTTGNIISSSHISALYNALNGTTSVDVSVNGKVHANSFTDRSNSSYYVNPDSYSHVDEIHLLDYTTKDHVGYFKDGSGTTGYLSLINHETNAHVVSLSEDDFDAGQINVNLRSGGKLVNVEANVANAGWLATYGPDGYTKIRLTTVEGSGGNRGYIGVYGPNGAHAWHVNARTGSARVVPYPGRGDRELILAPVQAFEAANVVRGRADLKGGQARVTLPAYFAARVSAESITIQLTPRSALSKGLAVVAQDATSFTVAELMEGNGSYGFDYAVTGTVRDESFPAEVAAGTATRWIGGPEEAGEAEEELDLEDMSFDDEDPLELLER